MHAFLSLPSLRRVVLIAVAVGATFACGMTAHAQTVVGPGQTLNLANSSYTAVDLLLQGGTASGSGNYNAYGASLITGVTVSGTVASTINGSSWFNILNPTTFTVADVTGNASTDLNVNISLRPLPGSPDTTYSSSSIIKEGAGTMEMTVHSYIWGPTTLNGGRLKVAGGNGGYGFFSGAVNVNAGTTLTIDSDGTGFGWQNGWKPTSVNINGGTVNGGGNHIWGISGGVNMTGGTLQVDSGSFQWNYTNLNTSASSDTATIAGPLNLRGDGGYSGLSANVADGAAETDLLISGNITELYGSLSISKSGSGTLRLSGANSYTGGTTLSAGTLLATTAAALPGYNASTKVSVASGATLAVSAGDAGQWTSSEIDSVLGGTTNAFAAGSNFGIDVTTGNTFSYDNNIGATQAGKGFMKSGAGSLTLSGANTYTGNTNVSAGGLIVNGSLGAGGVSVAQNASLGGSGTIAGAVNVLGTLSPGNSPGVITLGSLVLGGTSTTLIEFTNSTVRGTGYDGVDITTSSGLTYDGLLSLSFGNASPFADNTTFDIFAFTGSAAGAFTSVTSTGYYPGTWTSLGSGNFELVSGGQTLTFNQATGDINVVPEPSSIALVGLGGILAAIAARRRRR